MRQLTILILFLIILLPVAAFTDFRESQTVIRNSLVLITASTEYSRTTITNQTNFFTATGFFIDPSGLILTVGHICGKEINTLQVIDAQGKVYQASVISRVYSINNLSLDYAILKVSSPDRNFPSLKLTVQDLTKPELYTGMEVAHMGFPYAFRIKDAEIAPDFNSGRISSIKTIKNKKIIQHNIPTNPGNSGSPLFDDKGSVIGLINAGMIDGQNISFAIPSSEILGHLERLALQSGASTELHTEAPAGDIGKAVQQTVLNVSASVPESKIYLNGFYCGKTPQTINTLPGEHTLTVIRDGYQPVSRNLRLTAGNNPLNITLAVNRDYRELSEPAFLMFRPLDNIKTYKIPDDAYAYPKKYSAFLGITAGDHFPFADGNLAGYSKKTVMLPVPEIGFDADFVVYRLPSSFITIPLSVNYTYGNDFTPLRDGYNYSSYIQTTYEILSFHWSVNVLSGVNLYAFYSENSYIKMGFLTGLSLDSYTSKLTDSPEKLEINGYPFRLQAGTGWIVDLLKMEVIFSLNNDPVVHYEFLMGFNIGLAL